MAIAIFQGARSRWSDSYLQPSEYHVTEHIRGVLPGRAHRGPGWHNAVHRRWGSH